MGRYFEVGFIFIKLFSLADLLLISIKIATEVRSESDSKPIHRSSEKAHRFQRSLGLTFSFIDLCGILF